MKHLHTHLLPSLLALLSLSLFASCMDGDDSIGYDLQGHWFGDLDMWYGDIPARGSEIIFYSDGYGYSRGTGEQTDYYGRYGSTSITHHFAYRVEAGVIRLMFFDEPALDCDISNYTLTSTRFYGRIDGRHSSTTFSLRNYDREWDTYGYSGLDYDYDRRWYGYYYVKPQGASADSLWTAAAPTATDALMADSLAAPTRSADAPVRAMRGVNRQP